MDRHSSSTKKADRDAGHASTPHTRYTKNNSPFSVPGVVCECLGATHILHGVRMPWRNAHSAWCANALSQRTMHQLLTLGIRKIILSSLFSLLRSAWCANASAQLTILPSPFCVVCGATHYAISVPTAEEVCSLG